VDGALLRSAFHGIFITSVTVIDDDNDDDDDDDAMQITRWQSLRR